MARILVIDDQDRFREMLCEMLKKAGYETVAASDGKEGVELYRKQPTDLVITDIIMPRQEGMETINSEITNLIVGMKKALESPGIFGYDAKPPDIEEGK